MDNFPKNMGRQLPGHISPESAFVVQDYPYGFVQRCQIRYWTEENKRGQRFVSQTLNPKTGRWNKPKAGAYDPAVIMYLETDSGHVRSFSLSYYDPLEVWEAWAERFVLPEQTKKDVALFIALKRAYNARNGAETYSHTGA